MRTSGENENPRELSKEARDFISRCKDTTTFWYAILP
ncbi:putative ATP binding protein [Corchorus olitorius]|uniref:ATP binding protein n=1 Tax=Corchorus olitorius TaxID=93759 RepID=A0A1R3H8V7_9ROSI|nr:putative ATP binding protein [Corchorus olitorius]